MCVEGLNYILCNTSVLESLKKKKTKTKADYWNY